MPLKYGNNDENNVNDNLSSNSYTIILIVVMRVSVSNNNADEGGYPDRYSSINNDSSGKYENNHIYDDYQSV